MEEIRQRQAQFTAERDWNKFHQPRNLLLALVGEVGEVAELFQWQGEVSEGLPSWSQSQRESLSHELSDVLIYLLELAEKCHVDLPRAVLAKMELNAKKYPAARVQGSAKKYGVQRCGERTRQQSQPIAVPVRHWLSSSFPGWCTVHGGRGAPMAMVQGGSCVLFSF
ncbi:dCTP pyrophosphatase 1 [Aquarana catesbeiana]|uniref:dCTP pyrophosphatase 1 n=1 Tax=Aquarana catesbeiana TaxID=8400 RepID=UPI003CC94FB4